MNINLNSAQDDDNDGDDNSEGDNDDNQDDIGNFYRLNPI